MNNTVTKRALLTAMICLVPTASAHAAQLNDWDLEISGFMQAIGSVNIISSEGFDGDILDATAQGEIHFKPSIALDNGIKIQAEVQMSASGAGGGIDESFITIENRYGSVIVGSENSVGYNLSVTAPHVNFTVDPDVEYATELARFALVEGIGDRDLYAGALGTTRLENVDSNDSQRISYVTHRSNGLRWGVSYGPDSVRSEFGQTNCNQGTCRYVDGAVNYMHSANDMDIVLSGRLGFAKTKDNNNGLSSTPRVIGFGAQVGVQNLTFGGSYGKQSDAGASNGTAIDLGVSMDQGKRDYSATLFLGKSVDADVNQAFVGNVVVNSLSDEKLTVLLLGATEEVQPGVGVGLFGAYGKFEQVKNGGVSADGFVFGGTLDLTF